MQQIDLYNYSQYILYGLRTIYNLDVHEHIVQNVADFQEMSSYPDFLQVRRVQFFVQVFGNLVPRG